MASTRNDFFFRYRRLLMLGLGVLGFSLGPLLRRPVFVRLSELPALQGAGGRELWLHATAGLAAVLLGLAALWRTWGAAYLGTDVVQDKNLHTERLVGDGPYRYSRNPLYLGNMFLVLGFGLLVNAAAALVFVVGMWVLVRLFIRDEEAGMKETRGEGYHAYLKTVPRMIPALRPRIPAAGARPRWTQGFCGESILWAMTAAAGWLAVTMNGRRFGHVLLACIIVALPLFIWARWYAKYEKTAASQ